jgi:hypothetical protein
VKKFMGFKLEKEEHPFYLSPLITEMNTAATEANTDLDNAIF